MRNQFTNTNIQFEDHESLDALLDNLFNSFDCDESGARKWLSA
jgi:hypothetical protein